MSKEALVRSIKKWKGIVRGTGTDNGISNCSLCQKYYDNRCRGCPVEKVNNINCCIGSPYNEWDNHFQDVHQELSMPYKRVPYCRECLRLAKAELAFLESLRDINKEAK